MRHRYSVALAGAVALAATAGSATAAPTVAFETFIPVPADTANVQLGGAFSSFDISFADPVTGNIFIADRSNASVDIFSGTSETFLGRATGFTGQGATTSVSGADGVLTVTSTSGGVTTTTLYAGDGNSTLKVFNATNPAAPTQLQSISTGGTTRVDEMAYSPLTHQVLAANNAETPAFGNLFQTTLGTSPVTLLGAPPPGNQITVPTSQGGIPGGGLEQPVWVPNATKPGGGSFYITVPVLAGDPAAGIGGVAEISTTGTVLRTISLASLTLPGGGHITSCNPTGLALGASGNLMVGCSNVGTQAILLNPAGTGSIVETFAGLGGTDEIWYDPTTHAFYVTGNGGTNTTRFFDIITDDPLGGTISQTVHLPTTTSAHSITVDPFTGDVFVALAGTAGASGVNPCPTTAPFTNPGCIEVLAPVVPEPGSLPVLVVGLAGLIGLAVRRRLQ